MQIGIASLSIALMSPLELHMNAIKRYNQCAFKIKYTGSSIYFCHLLLFQIMSLFSYFRAFKWYVHHFSGSTNSKIASCQSLKCKKGIWKTFITLHKNSKTFFIFALQTLMTCHFWASWPWKKLYASFESPKIAKLTQHLKLGATPPQTPEN